MIKEVDLALDMDFIMEDLAKAELEPTISFEEAYKSWLEFINNLWK